MTTPVKRGRPHGSMNPDTAAKLDTLYTLIVARYLPPFYRCPSIATLAEECGCSPFAIRLRIAHLVQDGRLVKGPDGRVAPTTTAARIDAAFQKQREKDKMAHENDNQTRITVTADKNRNGKWILVDNGGGTLQEGYEYESREAAMDAARALWPANSVWDGKEDGNGWSIDISEA